MLPLPVNPVGTNIGEQGCELAHGLRTKVTMLEGGSTEQLVKEPIGGRLLKSYVLWGKMSVGCGMKGAGAYGGSGHFAVGPLGQA